jgi:hypothetical protein
MPFGLGFFATAGAGVAGSYDLLATQVLVSSAASVTFSSLSTYASTYKHLQIRYTEFYTADGFSSTMQFNADTAANYSSHGLYGQGSSVSSAASTGATYMLYNHFAIGHTSSTNTRTVGVIDILDAFNTTSNKTIRSFGGQVAPSTNLIFLHSGSWRNTAALTQITLGVNGAPQFAANSRFSLYGIKGA